jgi:putative SOS response-associated peptidase YedK
LKRCSRWAHRVVRAILAGRRCDEPTKIRDSELTKAVASDAGGAGNAFTLLTTEPGPDVAPIHDRQMVVIDRADWLAWLDLTRPEAELLRPLPVGSRAVEQVR